MENKLTNQTGNQTVEQEKPAKPPVETIIVEGFKPFGSTTIPTSREEIKRQLGFKRR